MSADDGVKEGGKEGGQQEGGSRKGGRGKAMTFPELMCCMYSVLGTNEAERLDDIAKARANKLDKFHPMDIHGRVYANQT
jgi:hypothetical protein